MMVEECLQYIIQSCVQHENSHLRLMAVAVLQLLTKKDESKRCLIDANAVEALVITLTDERSLVRKSAVIALFDLISNDEEQKCITVQCGILDSLRAILQGKSTSKDLIYWTLIMVHQLALSESAPEHMVDMGFVQLMGLMLRETYGNANMQKLCLHTIVRLVGNLEATAAQQRLTHLLDANIVALLISSFRHEDTEIVYWALGLTHEYVVKDVARDLFRANPNAPRIFCHLLVSQDANVAKIVLRILKFLGLRHPDFQIRLLAEDVLSRLIPCLAFEDDDCQYWSLTLLHDLAAHSEAHPVILELDAANALLELVSSTRPLIPLYVVDIIGYICSSPKNDELLLESNLVEALVKLVRSDNPDLRSGGLASLLNLAAKSSEMVTKMVESDCLDVLRDILLTSEKDRMQVMCSKILLIFAIKGHAHQELKSWHLRCILLPLLTNIINMSNDVVNLLFLNSGNDNFNLASSQSQKSNGNVAPTSPLDELKLQEHEQGQRHSLTSRPITSSNANTGNLDPQRAPSPSPISTARSSPKLSPSSGGYLSSAFAGAGTPMTSPDLAGSTYNLLLTSLVDRLTGMLESLSVFSLISSHIEDAVNVESTRFIRVCDSLMDLVVLPLLDSNFKLKNLRRYASVNNSVEQMLSPLPHTTEFLGSSNRDTGLQLSVGDEDSNREESLEIANIRQMLSRMAASVLASLCSHGTLTYLIQERFLNSLVSIAQEYPQMIEFVVTLLARVMERGVSRDTILFVPQAAKLVWTTSIKNNGVAKFYAVDLLDRITYADNGIDSQYVKLSTVDKTNGLSLSRNGLTLRNDEWTFESVRCTHGIHSHGKFQYDVIMHTNGLVQIGWATLDCRFDTICGKGVGDDYESYAYDGHRRKKWHAMENEGSDYGDLWEMGDVISCLIDLDEQSIIYCRNGISLGQAFMLVNVSKTWFPAMSLAASQGCAVLFGSKHDPLKYPQFGYESIASAVMDSSENVVSPISEHGELLKRNSISSMTESYHFLIPLSNNNNHENSNDYNHSGRYGSIAEGDHNEELNGNPISLQSPMRQTRRTLYSKLESFDDQREPSVYTGASDLLISPTLSSLSDAVETALPSMYFETAMGLFGNDLSVRPVIIGYIDRTNRLTAAAFVDEGCYMFSVERSPNDAHYFTQQLIVELRAAAENNDRSETDLQKAHTKSTLPIQSTNTESSITSSHASFPNNNSHEYETIPTSAQLISFTAKRKLQEDDVIGVALLIDDNLMQFTRNGHLFGQPVISKNSARLHVPFVCNLGMFRLNYGQQAFMYAPYNTTMAQLVMMEHLCRL